MTGRAALLDRDGTIIVERHYLSDPDQVELLPGAAEGLRTLRELGYALVVVTNQSGLSRGYFDWPRLDAIHARLRELLSLQGVQLDAIYVCSHLPDANCACRKPAPGLFEQAAADFGFGPASAIVIGDKACDVDLGRAVGATSFLVLTGYGAEAAKDPRVRPDHVVGDLREVAHHAAVRQLAADRAP